MSLEDTIPSSEIELVQSLDALIKSGDLPFALKILKQVETTFSQYNHYMEKVGLLTSNYELYC
jgi:hypothetical protein